jgi:hypothetical protein
MAARFAFSTRELMRLVGLAALNLALFQGAWMILVLPPITMLAAILNFTLFWTWVRRRRLSRPLLFAMLAGLAATVAIVMYLARSQKAPRLSEMICNWLPESLVQAMPAQWLIYPWMQFFDFVLLDLLGFGAMVGAGCLVAAYECSRTRRRRHLAAPDP